MKSVRRFLQGLRDLEGHANPAGTPIAVMHRRLVVPQASQFTLEDTLIRTYPISNVPNLEFPGSPDQTQQLLEWFEPAGTETGPGFDENELGTDLAAILALTTGRRVAFANEFPMRLEGASWTTFLEVGPNIDGELFGPVEPLYAERFTRVLQAIDVFDDAHAEALGASIRARNSACCLIDSDHSTAYSLLVVALETLSRAFGSPPTDWDEWDQSPVWDRLFDRLALSEDQTSALKNQLMQNKQLRLRRTFIEYSASILNEELWDQPYVPTTPKLEVHPDWVRRLGVSSHEPIKMSMLVPTDLRVLKRRLGLSYDTRSKVFHQSERLDQPGLMALPTTERQPLSFPGLRRVLDFALWTEIGRVTQQARQLPDIQIHNPE